MNNSKLFASADWSGTVKVYDVVSSNGQTGIVQKAETNVGAPIFSMHWVKAGNSPMIVVGCCDGAI